MTITARLLARAVVTDSANPVDADRIERAGEVTCTSLLPDEQVVDLVAGFNAITPPTGAQAVLIVVEATAVGILTMKGVTGDAGVQICDGGVLPTFPILLPLFEDGPGFTVGVGGTARLRLWWF